MKIELTSTSKIVTLNGPVGEVKARIWEGTTAKGIPVHAYITLISCDSLADVTEFIEDLQEVAAPSQEVADLPDRLTLNH